MRSITRLCVVLLFVLVQPALAQPDDQVENPGPEITLGVYMDLFYGYDFNRPTGESRLPFLYHHNRHNEFNLNHGLIYVNIRNPRYRANLALQTGTYVNDNYVGGDGIITAVFDANIGLALNEQRTLWLDAGIFGNSHLGMENTFSIDNINLSHNLTSENSPYYMAGAKLSYAHGEYWNFAALILNGWQRIRRVPGNSLPGFGTQVEYSKGSLSANWSTFIGSDDPDDTRRMLYFSNLYAYYQIDEEWRAGLLFDYGMRQVAIGSSEYDDWFGISALLQYTISPKWKAAGRYEYYSDPEEVIVSVPGPGYQTGAFSINADYSPIERILLRLEGRYFSGPNEIYPKEGDFVNSNFFLLGSVAFQLEKRLR